MLTIVKLFIRKNNIVWNVPLEGTEPNMNSSRIIQCVKFSEKQNKTYKAKEQNKMGGTKQDEYTEIK